jgi:hypothetical protein
MRFKQPGLCSSSAGCGIPEAAPSSAIASSQAQSSGSSVPPPLAGRASTDSRLAPQAKQFRLSDGQVPPHAGQVLRLTRSFCCLLMTPYRGADSCSDLSA